MRFQLVIYSALFFCYLQSQIATAEVIVDLTDGETISIHQASADEPIKIDGHLDEAIWVDLPAYDEFVVIEPDTLSDVPHATLVRFFYRDDGLYIGVEMVQPAETIIKRLSGRDVRRLNRDSVSITLDTSGEGRYGFWFGVNLGDSLSDGTVLPERKFTSNWDGAWDGRSQETDRGWSAELHIPWGTVSMPKSGKVRRLGFYMSRKVAYLDERWGWPGLTNTQPKFMSALQSLEVKGVNPKKQYSIFPYTSVTRDLIDDENIYRVGADFFWRPSTNILATGTINPDFGAVESDELIINFTATETFFPEKRLFFLEGQEVFVASPRADTRGGGVGNRGAPYTMVNTRRIGGTPRDPTLAAGESVNDRDLLLPVDLYGAAKVSGQIGRIRYGFLGAFEEDYKLNGVSSGEPIKVNQSGSDYGIARVIYEDNYQGAYRAVGFLTTAVLHEQGDALAQGVDGHYLTTDGKIKLDAQFISSDLDGVGRGYGGFVDGEYTFRQGVTQRLGIEYFDDKIDINDLGFLQRNGHFRIRTAHGRTTSNLGWARDNQFDVRGFIQRNHDDYFTGGGITFADRLTLNNLSSIRMSVGFRPKYYDDLNSFGNGLYRVEKSRDVDFSYSSPQVGRFNYFSGIGWREEALGGDQVSLRGGFNFNLRWADRDGWLLHQGGENFTTFQAEQWIPGLAIDYFLTAKQQFRASLQWVGIRAEEDLFYVIPETPGDLIEVDKPPGPSDSFGKTQLSFQIRYRWELAPLSDLFVVYTRGADEGVPFLDNNFSDLFDHAVDNPLVDLFVVKLRYRFGS